MKIILKKTTIAWAVFLTILLVLPLIAAAGNDHVANEVLVKFKRVSGNAERQRAIDSIRGNGIGTFRLDPDLVHLKIPENVGTNRAIAILAANPHVKYAVRNNIHHINSLPDDPEFFNQWALDNTGQSGGTPNADIDAADAWDIFTGSTRIVVAVLDTGVDYTHEDLAANIWTHSDEIPGNGIDDDGNGYVDDIHGYDFAYGDGAPMDGHGHGTACAGIIGAAGNNGTGVAGINWSVSIMSVKVLDDSGSGTTANIIRGIDYATANGAHLTSNSYGCSFCYNQAERDAIERANAAGVLFIASAGNSGLDTDIAAFAHYPSGYDNANVISVTATDKYDHQLYNYGPTTVDLAGCSPEITTTLPGNRYTGFFNGTSAACPHVAGVAALVWGYDQELNHMGVKNRLMDTVRPVDALAGKCVTGGAVNAYNALISGEFQPTPPEAPSDLLADAAACDRITLSWRDNSTDEDGFKIERSISGENFVQIDTVAKNVTAYDDGGLSENTAFAYRVRAYNAGGNSDYAGPAFATTAFCPGEIPAAPSDLTAKAVPKNGINLRWSDNSNNEDGFIIERGTDGKNFSGIASVDPNVTSYLDSANLVFKTTYYYRLKAHNAYGTAVSGIASARAK